MDRLVERIVSSGITAYGIAPSPHLHDSGLLGLQELIDGDRSSELTVSLGYRLVPEPSDPDHPANLRAEDDPVRVEVETPVAHPLPQWLVARRAAMRHPEYADLVQTRVALREPARSTLDETLRDHVQYVFVNQYREALGLPTVPTRADPALVDPHDVVAGPPIPVDGVVHESRVYDASPHVVGFGVAPSPDTVVTAVIPRSILHYVPLAFARWSVGERHAR